MLKIVSELIKVGSPYNPLAQVLILYISQWLIKVEGVKKNCRNKVVTSFTNDWYKFNEPLIYSQSLPLFIQLCKELLPLVIRKIRF